MNPELPSGVGLMTWLQAGFGATLLAVVVVLSWRKRSGNGHATPSLSAPHEPGVQYFQLATLITNLHDLSRDLAERDRRAEQDARDRHDEITACLEDWRKENVKTLEAIRRGRDVA